MEPLRPLCIPEPRAVGWSCLVLPMVAQHLSPRLSAEPAVWDSLSPLCTRVVQVSPSKLRDCEPTKQSSLIAVPDLWVCAGAVGTSARAQSQTLAGHSAAQGSAPCRGRQGSGPHTAACVLWLAHVPLMQGVAVTGFSVV